MAHGHLPLSVTMTFMSDFGVQREVREAMRPEVTFFLSSF
jgi:hypothetical protein